MHTRRQPSTALRTFNLTPCHQGVQSCSAPPDGWLWAAWRSWRCCHQRSLRLIVPASSSRPLRCATEPRFSANMKGGCQLGGVAVVQSRARHRRTGGSAFTRTLSKQQQQQHPPDLLQREGR
eukprot:scaffold115400_cov22-Tisochrysis_lutea.AAC.1